MSEFLEFFQRPTEKNSIRENCIKLALKNHFCGYTTITEDERAKADKIMKLLLGDITEKLIAEAHKWVVGEEKVIRALHICSSGRLVKNASMTSYNLNVNSESGSGKDHVTYNTLRIYEKNKLFFKRTRITPQAFTYWHANEPEWSWDNKILYLEDVSGKVLNSDTMKVMLSSGSHATVVKDQRSVDLEVKGKPVIIVTTAESAGNKENSRRLPTIQLDESTNQTDAIIVRAAQKAETGLKQDDDLLLQAALNLLSPKEVLIPYASSIAEHFPKSLVARTHFNRFLDLIKAHAALYQFQRDYDAHGKLIAAGVDYDAAREILMATTSNTAMVTLTHKQKKLLAILKEKCSLATSIKEIFSLQTIWQERQLRTELEKLADIGLLKKYNIEQDGKRDYTAYEYCSQADFDIPVFENIKNIATTTTSTINATTATTATDLKRKEGSAVVAQIAVQNQGSISDKIEAEEIEMSQYVEEVE